MKARLTHLIIASAAAAGFAGIAPAATPSLCNADGKVEVLSHASRVACGSGAEGEMRALLKVRARYGSDSSLTWQERAMIGARIERRIGELRREMRRSPG